MRHGACCVSGLGDDFDKTEILDRPDLPKFSQEDTFQRPTFPVKRRDSSNMPFALIRFAVSQFSRPIPANDAAPENMWSPYIIDDVFHSVRLLLKTLLS